MTCLLYTFDGKMILSGSADGTLKFWDFEKGAVINSIELKKNSVMDLALHPNGECVLAAYELNFANLWEISTGKLIKTFGGHHNSVAAVGFSQMESIWLQDLLIGLSDCGRLKKKVFLKN